MTFDQWQRPDLLHPPTWFETAVRKPPVNIVVMVKRDEHSEPTTDRAIVTEWVELDEATGRWERRRELLWSRAPERLWAICPVPLSHYKFWASAVFEDNR